MSKRNGNAGLKALAAIMSGLFILLAVAGVVAYFSDWFTNWDKFKIEQEEPTEETANGGMLIGESEGTGVSLLSEKIAKADYAANGVSPLAESAYTLTATVEPSNAVNKAVDWSVSFVNPSSSWATGKTVTDYVTVTPTSDGALTATVQNLKAFGEQIKVIVTHRENENATASCTVDFARKVTGAHFALGSYYDFTFGLDSEVFHTTGDYSTEKPSFELLWDEVYTIDDSFTCKLKVTADPNFMGAFKTALSDETAVQGLKNEATFSMKNPYDSSDYVFYNDSTNNPFYILPDESAFILLSTGTAYTSAVFGGNDEYHNAIGTIIEDNPSYYYYDLTLTVTGTYSTFSETVKIVPDREHYEFKVRSLNLNESTLVF